MLDRFLEAGDPVERGLSARKRKINKRKKSVNRFRAQHERKLIHSHKATQKQTLSHMVICTAR